MLWLCAGDFNEIMCDDEKWGGYLRSVRQMEDFRSVTQDCNFQELLFSGSKFIWSMAKGEEMILERLDRGFANARWLSMYPNTCEQHLIAS